MTESTKPPVFGDQREMLIAFNDLQRKNLLWKLEGITEAQLRQNHQPSGMSLLGLLKHLVRVEQTWFAGRLMGEPTDGESYTDEAWLPTTEETFPYLREKYLQAIQRSNEIASELPLEQEVTTSGSSGENVTLQWVLFHMIEETARHLGHADFIRESLDGATGVNAEHEANRQRRAENDQVS